jgi:hypothetical protein
MIKSLAVIVLALGAALAGAAQAQLADRERAVRPAPGTETRTWLDLQKSGAVAPTDPRPMSGEVGERVYQRYLDSHTRAIPESFRRESVGGGGAAN